MTALWIIGGAVAVLVAIAAVYYVTLHVVMLVLRLFGSLVLERKFVSKGMLWCVGRYDEHAIAAFAIIGWIVVFSTAAAIVGAAAFVIYFFLSFL